MQEDFRVDEQLQALDDQAYAARLAAEDEVNAAKRRTEEIEREAIRRREALNTQLSRQRQLRQAQQNFAEATLIATMVNEDPNSNAENVQPPEELTEQPSFDGNIQIQSVTGQVPPTADPNAIQSGNVSNTNNTEQLTIPDTSQILPSGDSQTLGNQIQRGPYPSDRVHPGVLHQGINPNPGNLTTCMPVYRQNDHYQGQMLNSAQQITTNDMSSTFPTATGVFTQQPSLVGYGTGIGSYPRSNPQVSFPPAMVVPQPLFLDSQAFPLPNMPYQQSQPQQHQALQPDIPTLPPTEQPTQLPAITGMIPQVGTPNLTELLISSSYGIPRPTLPNFTSGREKDFALLKMALDNLVNIHPHLTEQYKYQVLLDKLGGSAKRLAEAFMHDPKPFTAALQALKDKYGQPRQLVQSEIGILMNMPALRYGDFDGFDSFALSVHSLVGMLKSLEGETGYELRCGSHVDRLIGKLPPGYRDSFVEHCINRDILKADSDQTYTLCHLSDWLQTKSRAKRIANQATALYKMESTKPDRRYLSRTSQKGSAPTALFYARESKPFEQKPGSSARSHVTKPFCPYCNSNEHFLNICPGLKKLTVNQIHDWLHDGKRCWKCGRTHQPDMCTLKKPCHICKEVHLTVLHEAIQHTASKVYSVKVSTDKVYTDQPSYPPNVMLKVVKVLLYGESGMMETHAILDDGSMRTMVLQSTVHDLKLQTKPDSILLTTINKEPFRCNGHSVDLQISPISKPNIRYKIKGAFTADNLCMSEYTYPVESLQRRWPHLQKLPIPNIDGARPTILIGSDNAHLILPNEPVQFGPINAPIAVSTKLGWSLQGLSSESGPENTKCMLIHSTNNSDLVESIERLWQIDTLPFTEKHVTRSKQDKQAIETLESETIRMDVDGVSHYATPLLRTQDGTCFKTDQQMVMPTLRRTERRLRDRPDLSRIHNDKIKKLVEAGYVKKLTKEEVEKAEESWYFPHHIVEHNGKFRLVFNCSFEHNGQILNKHLLPGPTVGSSLLGVFLRFRQHAVAISGDIKAMFHQVRLLSRDKPLLRFIWRNMEHDRPPDVYEWQVLPFGTTCSPCCASYALWKHVSDHKAGNEEVLKSVEESFYVDNCLHSLPTATEAKELVRKMRDLLAQGGFNIRQWTSNIPSVVADLPSDARSENTELWLTFGQGDSLEPALGLHWNCESDELTYKHRTIEYEKLTMRVIYRILASQYDPIGYLAPFLARAKIIVQDLWKSKRNWNDPIEKGDICERWLTWEKELEEIPMVTLPRCYTPHGVDSGSADRQLHIFCDASERVYGSVAYLRTTDEGANIYVSFLMARSKVSPKKQLSMPRLELCAALTGAQLADVLCKELTLPIQKVILWSDSTTVLGWLKSESCRYKVFVGTRVSEIQNLTDVQNWRYVDTQRNPADDITRGKLLRELSKESRWKDGPDFMHQTPDHWPVTPVTIDSDNTEIKKSVMCGTIVVNTPQLPDAEQYTSWDVFVADVKESFDGAAFLENAQPLTAERFEQIENHLYQLVQIESFPQEFTALKSGKRLPPDSRLLQLDPIYDAESDLIRVGGRLQRAESLNTGIKHPILLDPQHVITKLIIRDQDEKLLHYGQERILAEIRRRFWILRGREAIRRHQRQCSTCQKWRSNPRSQKMSDLPPPRLRLFKPPFFSTGVDCFGPMHVKVGRRSEKRWGLIFKCMTTRAVHLDILRSMDSDAFLMAFRRFASLRGKPYELISDQGSNFRGAKTELQEALASMEPDLAEQLARHKVRFVFNPPHAPHFGGVWEREIKSVKYGLRVALGDQTVTEPVLRTILAEVAGILNSKPLAYISSDVRDVDPVTPNILLIGRHDASLPQVVYPADELLSRRRWRHSQVLADHFWVHFVKYYLPDMQLRTKWQKERQNLKMNDVVMIVDPQLLRAQWPVGRVTKTYPGTDGCVRTATVSVKDKEYTRPITRLIPLPECADDDN
ncbi:uncharacterized protein LOC124128018 [Haliotis rufescens]|uniref:uncharacterized protein LOC124128018 n=1 Tax=Haliotis rufescens TaxID=6454 RepID=UPI00201F4FD5|nr:uncharacterized protein LOC124128018 [Haliotis rufescens]